MNFKFLFLLPLLSLPACSQETPSDLVKVGDPAPEFSITTTEDAEISTGKLKGKVILINFFATWCGPCLAELPHLETDVWQTFKDRGLTLVVIGREHTSEELVKFKAEKKLTMPFAADPKREIYAKYATKFIPRNVLIGADGKVVFQSMGFNAAEFAQMKTVIEAELAKVK